MQTSKQTFIDICCDELFLSDIFNFHFSLYGYLNIWRVIILIINGEISGKRTGMGQCQRRTA